MRPHLIPALAAPVLLLSPLQALSPADYSIAPPISLGVPTSNPQLVTGDWNGDGLADFAVWDGNATAFPIDLVIFTASQELTYPATVTLSLNAIPHPNGSPVDNSAGDDIVLFPAQDNGGQVFLAYLSSDGTGANFTQSPLVASGASLPIDPNGSMFLLDANADGLTDAVASFGSTLTAFLATGSGFQGDGNVFSAVGAVPIPQMPPTSSRFANIFQQTIFDQFNNPIGVANEVNTAVYGTSGWQFENTLISWSNSDGTIDRFPVVATDVDGDGRRDLIAVDLQPVAFLADGSGAFSPTRQLVVSGLTGNLLNAGDLDGDEDEDLIEYRANNDAFVMENQGGGSYAGFTVALPGGGSFPILGSAQLAGDPRPDLYGLRNGEGGVELLIAVAGGAPPAQGGTSWVVH